MEIVSDDQVKRLDKAQILTSSQMHSMVNMLIGADPELFDRLYKLAQEVNIISEDGR
jgi:hypothetical protein